MTLSIFFLAGAAPHCSSLARETCELIVGRTEGIFTYSVEDRGGAAGFEGIASYSTHPPPPLLSCSYPTASSYLPNLPLLMYPIPLIHSVTDTQPPYSLS